jgi:hypothetical protein
VWLICLTALAVAFAQLMYKDSLRDITELFTDPRMQAVAASLFLFAPTSFLVGVTSPYLAKLNVRSLKTTGQSIAGLDAANALGGIIGTFITGFFLFGYVGSRETLSIVIVLLLATSWLLVPGYRMIQRILFGIALLAVVAVPVAVSTAVVDIDTPSAHYQVVGFTSGMYAATGLLTGPAGVQSAVYKSGSSEPVFWYNQELARLAVAQKPARVLVLGGGAFTLPQYLAEQLPGSTIDVVEIDPELKAISEQYFHYKNPKNVNLIFDDARHYAQTTAQLYDMVIVDVYGDTSIPFSLITKEFSDALHARVAPTGTVAVNVIAGLGNDQCRTVFSVIDATYRQHFGYALYSNERLRQEKRSNHVVLYSREPQVVTGMNRLVDLNGQLLTDNYAPTERLYYDRHQSVA